MENNKEIIAVTDIPRDNNFLYVCGSDENGNITIIKVKRGKNKSKNNTTKEVQ